MHSLTQWTDLATRAGQVAGASELAPGDGPSVSVVFKVTGVVQGAVHARLGDTPGLDEANRLASALEAQAEAAGHALQIIWCAPTRGPHLGHPSGPVVCHLEALSLPAAISPLHIEQTIGTAQKLGETSVLAIGEQMHGIFELAKNHADGLKEVAAQFSTEHLDAGPNVAGSIDRLSRQMRTFGEVVVERTTRQAADIEQARAWTADIIRLGQAVGQIASNARMLAFNARLEAARLGEHGRGFGVIADSIKELANQVARSNQAVGELAENLAHALPRLAADATQTSIATRTSVGELDSHLDLVQAALAGVRSKSWEALTAAATVARELQDKANAVIHHLQFQDRTNQLLTEASEQAQAVIALAGLSEAPVDDAFLEQVGALGKQAGFQPSSGREGGSVELF
jgi:hypothetical protein